jgi:hypothetical protein
MKALILATNVSAAAAAAQTAVQATATPFLSGRDVICHIEKTGVTGTPTIKVQGSDDGTTYTDLVSSTTLTNVVSNIKCMRYNRVNVTVAGSAGTINVWFENGA